MRMMCLRLLRGFRSGYASVDTLGAMITPLFTLYNPSVALWVRVGVRVDSATARAHGSWYMVVSASMCKNACNGGTMGIGDC